jgi:hypothetical protein
MKYIKIFEEYENSVLGASHKKDGWRILQLDTREETEELFNKWYDDAEWVSRDDNFDVYYRDNKLAILVDYKNYIIKTKEVSSEPLYKIRDKKLTRPQELSIRMWIGTDRNPKHNKFKGEYLGMQGEYALVRSPLSGKIIKIDKEGENILE